MKLVNVGFGNMVSADKIVTILSPESAPVKRMIQEAKDDKIVIDATCGRKTRAVLTMDSGQIVLTPVMPETIVTRIGKENTLKEETKIEKEEEIPNEESLEEELEEIQKEEEEEGEILND